VQNVIERIRDYVAAYYPEGGPFAGITMTWPCDVVDALRNAGLLGDTDGGA